MARTKKKTGIFFLFIVLVLTIVGLAFLPNYIMKKISHKSFTEYEEHYAEENEKDKHLRKAVLIRMLFLILVLPA